MPYSAALISLSVPSTPTRSTLTSTPRPLGTSSSEGLGSCPRCIESGLPGKTAIAFIMVWPGLGAGSLRLAVARPAAPPRSVLGMNFSLLLYELDRVTIGVSHQDATAEAEGRVREVHRRLGYESKPSAANRSGSGGRVGYQNRCLPMDEVIRAFIGRIGPAV